MADFFSSEKITDHTQNILYKVLNNIADGLNDSPGFISASEYDSSHFYLGNESFFDTASGGDKWRLGYACVDLTPRDHETHDYYLGGYLTIENGFNNKIESIVDKMQCRIIALDDGTGRGISFFGTIDCIGTGNTDIKRIRRRFANIMHYKHPDAKITSVNIFSTHTHSCVDTQGLWTDTFGKIKRNRKKNKKGKGTYINGTDSEYMEFLVNTVAEGLLNAYETLIPGMMTFAVKDIGKEYFCNKNRKSATSLITDMLRIVFTPDDTSVMPTIIASVGAHPDVAGLPTTDGQGTGRELCGDYIYYMGEFINRAGFNFMFFNGAICAIYMARGATNDGIKFEHRYEQSIRYGRELARIALSLTKNIDQIKNDPILYNENEIISERKTSDANGIPYTLWCKNWEPTVEKQLYPLLNIRLAEVKIPVLNPFIKIVGKLNLASYKVLKEKDGSYSIVTEIGYMELGNELNIVFVPGEFCSDMLVGGSSLSAKGSYSKTDFQYPPLQEIFAKKLYPFGLANDAIGYIVPDNDYVLGEFSNHYHELISLGSKTGSSVIRGFIDLKKDIEGR